MANHAVALALALAASLPVLQAAPSAGRRRWEIATFTWIERAPAEKGAAPNSQPLVADPALVAKALGSVQCHAGAQAEPLFAADEAADLGRIMAQALAVAGPGEDLQLVSTAKRGSGAFKSSLAVTARAFVQDGRLNLIVHDVRLDLVQEFLIFNKVPDYQFGSRAAAGPAVLTAAGAEARRADWVVLPLGQAAAATPDTPAAAPAPAGPPPPAEPPPPSANLLERLRVLKQARELNLITEEEYTQKRQELLKSF